MPFEPGVIQNPRGRPHKTQQQKDFECKCRDWSALYAFDKLKKWTENENPKVATWALSELLNRGFGKSAETSYIETNVTQQLSIGPEEIRTRINELISGEETKAIGFDGENAVEPTE